MSRHFLASARQHVFEARAAQRLDTLSDEAARFADSAAAAGGTAAPAFEEGELASMTPLALSPPAPRARRRLLWTLSWRSPQTRRRWPRPPRCAHSSLRGGGRGSRLGAFTWPF